MAKYKAITNLSSNPNTYKGSTIPKDFAILARNFKDLIEDYNKLKAFIDAADLAAEVDHLAGITLNDGRRKFQPKTGILIPMYISPSFIFANTDYNTLIDLGKEYPTVPLVVILNPDSGPGTVVSADYTVAIKRLQGAGATVIGYISTAFTVNTLKEVTTEVDTWLSLYPGIDGIFYDEMTNAVGTDDINVTYYKDLADYIHSKSLYPAIGNPGSLPNVKYYTENTADVIVMVEQAGMPTEATLKGDFADGNADFVKYDRAAIVHTKPSLLVSEIDLLSKYTSLIYITDDILANPYDTLSKYLEQLFQILTSKLWDAVNTDWHYEVAKNRIVGITSIHKFGRNPDIDTASGFEALWNGGGDYTGHDCIVAETLETSSSSANDAGTLLSSGTATGGSLTTLEDSGATFVTDGVAAGDVYVNDTLLDDAIVTAVTETEITFLTMSDNALTVSTNSYRIVTKASTGTPVIKLQLLLDGDFDNETSEYIILNGTANVDTVGTYIRHSRSHNHGGANVGSITTRQKTTTANVTMVLPIGYNTTMIAAYTVPKGKTCVFTDWFTALAKKQAGFSNARLMIRAVNDVFQILEEGTVATTGSSYVLRGFQVPKDSLNQMTDIKIMADTSVDNMAISGGFDLILEDI